MLLLHSASLSPPYIPDGGDGRYLLLLVNVFVRVLLANFLDTILSKHAHGFVSGAGARLHDAYLSS